MIKKTIIKKRVWQCSFSLVLRPLNLTGYSYFRYKFRFLSPKFCVRCVAVVPSVAVVSPSHCPLLSSPLAVVPSGHGGLACPAAALALPLPQNLCHAALATAALPPPPLHCRHLRRAKPPPPCCPSSSLPPRYPRHPAAALPS